MSPAVAAADNQCAFGKWLYSLPTDVQQTLRRQSVKRLHACFHREAGGVLDHALGGRKETAMKCVAFGGPFAEASAELTREMMEWRKALTESSLEAVQAGEQTS